MRQFAVILLVDRRGHLLLQERDEHAPIAPDQWGMVGGHVEDGEDSDDAAYRELLEETGLDLPRGSLSLWRDEETVSSDGGPGHFRVHAAAVDLTDADIVIGEGRRIVFVDPAEVGELDLAASARHFVTAFLASATYRGLASLG